jgi:hypothetical protein
MNNFLILTNITIFFSKIGTLKTIIMAFFTNSVFIEVAIWTLLKTLKNLKIKDKK